MLTNQEAMRLIGLPKKVTEKGIPVDAISWRWKNGKARYFLSAEREPNYSFLLDIQQSLKNNLKITLHFQENTSKTGLLRIDWSYPALVDSVELSTQSPFAISFS